MKRNGDFVGLDVKGEWVINDFEPDDYENSKSTNTFLDNKNKSIFNITNNFDISDELDSNGYRKADYMDDSTPFQNLSWDDFKGESKKKKKRDEKMKSKFKEPLPVKEDRSINKKGRPTLNNKKNNMLNKERYQDKNRYPENSNYASSSRNDNFIDDYVSEIEEDDEGEEERITTDLDNIEEESEESEDEDGNIKRNKDGVENFAKTLTKFNIANNYTINSRKKRCCTVFTTNMRNESLKDEFKMAERRFNENMFNVEIEHNLETLKDDINNVIIKNNRFYGSSKLGSHKKMELLTFEDVFIHQTKCCVNPNLRNRMILENFTEMSDKCKDSLMTSVETPQGISKVMNTEMGKMLSMCLRNQQLSLNIKQDKTIYTNAFQKKSSTQLSDKSKLAVLKKSLSSLVNNNQKKKTLENGENTSLATLLIRTSNKKAFGGLSDINTQKSVIEEIN